MLIVQVTVLERLRYLRQQICQNIHRVSIANCVIHYNAQILSELKECNEHEGRSENLEALKRISPVAWFYINFSGFYSFADSENSHDFAELARTVHLEA